MSFLQVEDIVLDAVWCVAFAEAGPPVQPSGSPNLSCGGGVGGETPGQETCRGAGSGAPGARALARPEAGGVRSRGGSAGTESIVCFCTYHPAGAGTARTRRGSRGRTRAGVTARLLALPAASGCCR